MHNFVFHIYFRQAPASVLDHFIIPKKLLFITPIYSKIKKRHYNKKLNLVSQGLIEIIFLYSINRKTQLQQGFAATGFSN